MIVSLATPQTIEMKYVDENADLNISVPPKPNILTENTAGVGNYPDRIKRARELLEKGFQVKEKLYNVLLEVDDKFFKRLLESKPDATLNFLSKVLPRDDMEEQSSEKRMPVLIINNTAQAAIAENEN